MRVLPKRRRHGFVKQRQVEVFDVYEFELGIATLSSDFVNPIGHGLGLTTGPRASDDDGYSKHKFLPCGFRYQYPAFTLAQLNNSYAPSLRLRL
jgi:hypothetical protein